MTIVDAPRERGIDLVGPAIAHGQSEIGSSSRIRMRRRTNSPVVTGIRTVDMVMSVLLVAFAALIAFDNWRVGMSWAPRPAGRLFPLLSLGHPWRRRALRPRSPPTQRREARKLRHARPVPPRAAGLRADAAVHPRHPVVGIYVASFLLVAGFMRYVGRIAWWKCAADGLSSPLRCSSPSRSRSTSSCRKGRSKRPSATRAGRMEASSS